MHQIKNNNSDKIDKNNKNYQIFHREIRFIFTKQLR